MALAGQPPQMVRRRGPAGRLVEDRAIEIEHLVDPQDQRAGPAPGDFPGNLRCLHFGKRIGNPAGRRALCRQALLDGRLVDARRFDIERQAGVFQHRRAGPAARGQNQRRRIGAGQRSRFIHRRPLTRSDRAGPG